MQRILDPRSYLLPLACCLLFVGSCSQGEGGRCQINSDCASGLTCSDTTGNGICRSNVSNPATDAALQSSPDAGLEAVLDAGLDDGGATLMDSAAVDVFTADDAVAESD